MTMSNQTAPLIAAQHVAIITDGNRRWAAAHNLPAAQGHKAGADTLKARLRDAAEFGIEQLTVYSFSTENWARPAAEVHELLAMLAYRIAHETPQLHQAGVRMRFIGRIDQLANQLREQIHNAEALTADNQRLTLFIAINYGGRAEIIDAARRLRGSIGQDFKHLLYAPDMHDPELVIRTGGERRLSNFLLWQAAESELVFRDEFWPDFTRASLAESLAEYSRRQRPSQRTIDSSADSIGSAHRTIRAIGKLNKGPSEARGLLPPAASTHQG
jgi:undecaprenyl diphosphate synthase